MGWTDSEVHYWGYDLASGFLGIAIYIPSWWLEFLVLLEKPLWKNHQATNVEHVSVGNISNCCEPRKKEIGGLLLNSPDIQLEPILQFASGSMPLKGIDEPHGWTGN